MMQVIGRVRPEPACHSKVLLTASCEANCLREAARMFFTVENLFVLSPRHILHPRSVQVPPRQQERVTFQRQCSQNNTC